MKRIALQDIFDAAWQAFIIEDRPPAMEKAQDNTRYICRYLTKDGRKCAVGLCIPDGHPYQLTESTLDDLVHDEYYLEQSSQIFDGSLYDMDWRKLWQFQSKLHDDLAKAGRWVCSNEQRRETYLKIAADYNLTIPGEEV